MEIREKLIEARRSIGTQANVVTVAVMTMSVYVIARALEGSVRGRRPADPEIQAIYSDLSFSFAALSVLWPLIIGMLSVILAALIERERLIGSLLRDQFPETDVRIVDAVSAIYLPQGQVAHTPIRLTLLLAVPTFAVLAHGLSLVLALIVPMVRDGPTSVDGIDVTIAALGLVTVGVSLVWTDALRGVSAASSP